MVPLPPLYNSSPDFSIPFPLSVTRGTLKSGSYHGSEMSVEQYGARLLDEVQEEGLDEVSDGNLSAHSQVTQPRPPSQPLT